MGAAVHDMQAPEAGRDHHVYHAQGSTGSDEEDEDNESDKGHVQVSAPVCGGKTMRGWAGALLSRTR